MRAYLCPVCGFLYDEESADISTEGNVIPFEELDFDWICPSCGSKSELFQPTISNRPHDVPVDNE
jgi:Rubredoxin